MAFEVNPGDRRRGGYSLPEIAAAAGILMVVLVLLLFLGRQFSQQGKALLEKNAFHLEVGSLFEKIRRDLRSLKDVEVQPNALTLVRFNESSSAGVPLEQKVTYDQDGDAIRETRDGTSILHSFGPILESARADLFFRLEVSSLSNALDWQEGTLLVTIFAVTKGESPIIPLVATASWHLRARSISSGRDEARETP